MTNQIPVEIYGIFLAMSAVMVGIGASQSKGLIILIGGVFVLVFGIFPDQIIMGSQVQSSTQTGSITTYSYSTVPFTVPPIMRVSVSTLGVMIMTVGMLIYTDKLK